MELVELVTKFSSGRPHQFAEEALGQTAEMLEDARRSNHYTGNFVNQMQ